MKENMEKELNPIETKRNEIKGYVEDIASSTDPEVQEDFYQKMKKAEEELKALENKEIYEKIDQEIKEKIQAKRNEIKEYENQIKEYESGNKFKLSPGAIDILHKKINKAEDELRALEKGEGQDGAKKHEDEENEEEKPTKPEDAESIEKEPTLAERIQEMKTIEHLITLLNSIEGIQGEKVYFTGEDLAQLVQKVADGTLHLNYITRSEGLRAKVKQLLEERENEEKLDDDDGEEEKTPTPKPEDIEPITPTPPPLPPMPPSPEETEKLRENLNALYEELEDARAKFIKEHQEYLKNRKKESLISRLKAKLGMQKAEEEEELPESLNEARAEYDKAKLDYSIELAQVLKQEGRTQPEINVQVYDEVILNEYGLRKQAEAESWTPKEKGALRRGLDWYMKQNRFTRVAVSTGLLTGAVAATGGFGAAAGGLFFASNYVRGMAAVTLGHLSGLGFDKVFKDKTKEKLTDTIQSERDYVAGITDIKSSDIDSLHEFEEQLKNAYDKAESDKRRRQLAKSAVMLAATLGTSAGLKSLEGFLVSGGMASGAVTEASSSIPESSGIDAENIVANPELDQVAPVSETPEIPEVPEVPVAPIYQTIDTPDESGGMYEADPVVEEPVAMPEVIVDPFALSSTDVIITPSANNLWSAIQSKLQTEGVLSQLSTSGQQTELVDNVYNVFEKMTPEQLKSIGIASGDVQRVMTGSTIDLSEVFGKPELLKSMFEGSSELSQQAIIDIEAQGKVISTFASANPDTMLTPDLIKKLVTEAGL